MTLSGPKSPQTDLRVRLHDLQSKSFCWELEKPKGPKSPQTDLHVRNQLGFVIYFGTYTGNLAPCLGRDTECFESMRGHQVASGDLSFSDKIPSGM
jgi:hypothetical protein